MNFNKEQELSPNKDMHLVGCTSTKTLQRTLITMLGFDVLFMFIHLTIESMDMRCQCNIKMDYYVIIMMPI